MTPFRVMVVLQILALVVIVRNVLTRKWIDPKWRHSLTNNLIFWIVSGLITLAVGGVIGVVLWNRPPTTHPRIRLGGVTLQPGKASTERLAEVQFRNTGDASTAVSIDARPIHLDATQADIRLLGDEIQRRLNAALDRGHPDAPKDMFVPDGEGRSVTFQIGPAQDEKQTQVIGGRITYLDGDVRRIREFCYYWLPDQPKAWLCPFMNSESPTP